MKSLSCRSCGASLTADNMDRRLAIITCERCGAIYDLSSRSMREGVDSENQPSGEQRAPGPLPARFNMKKDTFGVRIRWRWFRWSQLFLIFFAMAWDSFLVFWYVAAFTAEGAPLIVKIFPLGHVAVGLGITYTALAGLLNTTVLKAEGGKLTVRHFPLPWYPAPTVSQSDLEQLYVTRKTTHSKNGARLTYQLRAVTRDHSGKLLLKGLDELEQALYLEQVLEETLDIRDRRVAGECQGDGHQV